MEEKKIKNPIWDGTLRIALLIGFLIFAVLWCVVIFFLWIYDAIFGGWK
tara:strand:- start:645 stop:791 length:147 start_codon:yes stop_codon:yes gene_type:complete